MGDLDRTLGALAEPTRTRVRVYRLRAAPFRELQRWITERFTATNTVT